MMTSKPAKWIREQGMEYRALLSALAVLLCASGSVAQEKSTRGEYVAGDLPCDIVFVKQVLTRSEVLSTTRGSSPAATCSCCDETERCTT